MSDLVHAAGVDADVSEDPTGAIPSRGRDSKPKMSEVLVTVAPQDVVVLEGFNLRSAVDADAQAELVASIGELGVLQPLVCDTVAGEYVLVDGHRRRDAAIALGLTHVPVVVRDDRDDANLARALVLNLRRQGFNPVDEANGYQKLIAAGRTRDEVARLVGCSPEHVAGRLRLLKLPDGVRDRLAQREIPVAAARSLEQIAVVSPAVAGVVGDALAGGAITAAELEREPAAAVAEAVDAATDPPFMFSVFTSYGRYPGSIETQLTGTGFAREAFGDLHAAGERWLRLAVADPQYYQQLRLEEDAVDAARAYGCLLDVTNADDDSRRGWGGRWFTDPEWVADALVQRFEAEIGKLERAARKRSGVKPTAGDAEAEDGEKAERAALREQDARERRDATIRNAALAAEAFVNVTADHHPLDQARLVTYLALMAYEDTVAQGARLCEREHRFESTRETKSGAVTKTTYTTRGVAWGRVVEDVMSAKTADQVIGAAVRYLLEGWLCDQAAVARSDRRHQPIPGAYTYGGVTPLEAEIPRLLVALADGWAPQELLAPVRDIAAAAAAAILDAGDEEAP